MKQHHTYPVHLPPLQGSCDAAVARQPRTNSTRLPSSRLRPDARHRCSSMTYGNHPITCFCGQSARGKGHWRRKRRSDGACAQVEEKVRSKWQREHEYGSECRRRTLRVVRRRSFSPRALRQLSLSHLILSSLHAQDILELAAMILGSTC